MTITCKAGPRDQCIYSDGMACKYGVLVALGVHSLPS